MDPAHRFSRAFSHAECVMPCLSVWGMRSCRAELLPFGHFGQELFPIWLAIGSGDNAERKTLGGHGRHGIPANGRHTTAAI